MTEPTPTPEKQNSPAAPDADENATGFFNRVQRELNPEPIHPSEKAEIVIMEGDDEGGDDEGDDDEGDGDDADE